MKKRIHIHIQTQTPFYCLYNQSRFPGMWCGQSFRTLAEMTQHMKITQHYTNIISQEQITSWRQPESSDSVSSKHGKQSTHLRSLEDNHDDSSDKFNDSDRDENFSNDDDSEQQSKHQPSSQYTSRLDHQHNKNNDSTDNNSITGSNHGESPSTSLKNLASSKPVTRSRKRENESLPIKRDPVGKVNSPTTSSSSQPHQNSSSSSVNLILSDLNEDSETNKSSVESKINGKSQKSSEKSTKVTTNREGVEEEEEEVERRGKGKELEERGEGEKREDDNDNEETEQDLDGEDDNLKRDENLKPNGDSSVRPEDEKLKDMTNEEDDTIGDKDRDETENDDDNDEGRSETNESADTTTSNSKPRAAQKGETGDPLSALETMVEKSFDPRLRPGVANGGILQRLGIDEEVCPPWQHINYANWYAAAAYGHPMAAALLAAGINLQNGIKLSKNIDSKKNED